MTHITFLEWSGMMVEKLTISVFNRKDGVHWGKWQRWIFYLVAPAFRQGSTWPHSSFWTKDLKSSDKRKKLHTSLRAHLNIFGTWWETPPNTDIILSITFPLTKWRSESQLTLTLPEFIIWHIVLVKLINAICYCKKTYMLASEHTMLVNVLHVL